MNDMITIEDAEMQIREYNGQRVVTLKDIDKVHGKKTDTAKKSFQKHKKHFVLGEDYFEITRKELGERYSPKEKIKGNPSLITYLITESGYLMIVKSFTDDLSWQVQRQLVNAYFNVRKTESVPAVRQKYHTSNTPVPKNPNWYMRNRRRIKWICKQEDVPVETLNHNILLRLGEEYDLEAANEIYEAELGKKPVYALDIVSYFPELAELADAYIRTVEKLYQ